MLVTFFLSAMADGNDTLGIIRRFFGAKFHMWQFQLRVLFLVKGNVVCTSARGCPQDFHMHFCFRKCEILMCSITLEQGLMDQNLFTLGFSYIV